MAYREHRIAVPGAACLWSVDLGGAPGRVVPDGCLDLMWHAESGRLVVAGPDTTAQFTALGGGRLVGLRYRPGASGFGVPVDALRDGRPDLAEVWGRERAGRLADALAGASTARAHALLLAAAPPRPDDFADRVRALAARTGRVAEVADAVGYGERQLHRRCLAAFGYGAKTLHRVLRFQRALGLARGGAGFAAVAAEAGYADQAHLARDVRDLGGTTLSGLVGAPAAS